MQNRSLFAKQLHIKRLGHLALALVMTVLVLLPTVAFGENEILPDDSVPVIPFSAMEESGLRLFFREYPQYAFVVLLMLMLFTAMIAATALARYEEIKSNKSEAARRDELAKSLTFTNFFLEPYVSAYYINLDSGAYTAYKRTDGLANNYPIEKDWFGSFSKYIHTDVHPDDRETLETMFNPAAVRKLMKTHAEYTHIFRDISDGIEKEYKMQILRGAGENDFALGFMDITEQLKEERKYLWALCLFPTSY